MGVSKLKSAPRIKAWNTDKDIIKMEHRGIEPLTFWLPEEHSSDLKHFNRC